jgi:hypothetical protein
MPSVGSERASNTNSTANRCVKHTSRGTKSRLIQLADSQQLVHCLSRCKILAESQATREAADEASNTFELELRESQPEDAIVAPTDGSKAGTIVSADKNKAKDEDFDERFADNFDGIERACLPRFQNPARTLKQRKSCGLLDMHIALLYLLILPVIYSFASTAISIDSTTLLVLIP